jgi:hypothetical protein
MTRSLLSINRACVGTVVVDRSPLGMAASG